MKSSVYYYSGQSKNFLIFLPTLEHREKTLAQLQLLVMAGKSSLLIPHSHNVFILACDNDEDLSDFRRGIPDAKPTWRNTLQFDFGGKKLASMFLNVYDSLSRYADPGSEVHSDIPNLDRHSEIFNLVYDVIFYDEAITRFSLTVLYCDEYVRIKEEGRRVALQSSNSVEAQMVRFLEIMHRLPIELQMIICYLTIGSKKHNIVSLEFESVLKKVLQHF